MGSRAAVPALPYRLTLFLILLLAFSSSGLAQTPSCTSEAPATSSVPSTASTQRIYAFGVQNATSVMFPTWWIASGNPNWLQGTNAGNGTWYVDVQLNQFDVGNPRYGNFETDVYLSNSTNTNVWCGGGSWVRNSAAQVGNSAERYLYDANHRLTYASTGGSVGNYDYDPLGNILSITQATPPAITNITPAQGQPGTQVTIQGGPFPTGSITASFNGPSVPVTMTDANDLVAVVPSGSNTGYVAVTFPDGTVATSPMIFTVLPNSPDIQGAQPSITGFTPGSGSAGSNVIVTGTNFNPVSGQTVVSLGGSQAAITSISDTQITFTVPAGQGTGYIIVTTPYGTAQSATTFVVNLSSNYPIVQLTLGDPTAKTLALSGTGACGAYTFSGQAASWVSLQLSSLTTTPSSGSVNWMLYGPNNQPVTNLDNTTFNQSRLNICGQSAIDAVTGSVSSSNLSVHLPPLPSTGSYTLVFAGGSTSDSLSASVSADPVVTQGGTVAAIIGASYQSTRVQFAGVAGQLLVADAQTTSVAPTGSSITKSWLSPMALPVGASVQDPINSTATIVAGADQPIYGGLLLSAASGVTGTVQITLDTTTLASISQGASPVTINNPIPGKAARLSLGLTAGQPVTLAISSITSTAGGLGATLYDPSGNAFTTFSTCPISTSYHRGRCNWDLAGALSLFPTPPESGTYTLVLRPSPYDAATYSGSVSLTNDLSVTIAEGTQTAVNLTRPGETERMTFTGNGSPTIVNVLNGTASPVGGGEGMWSWTYYPTTSPSLIQAIGVKNGYGMLYWYVPSNGQQMTLQLEVDTQSAAALVGEGSAGTGSATVLLDQSAPILQVNRSVTVQTSVNGQARQLALGFTTANQQIQVTLTNVTTTATKMQGVVFNDDGGGNWNLNYLNLGQCAVSAGTCTFPTSMTSQPDEHVVLVLYPYGGAAAGSYSPPLLPVSASATFSATVSMSPQ